ncbi:MAG: hypothetical protein O7B26_11125 [Planctomycetota bacterium]|nr:hypothetical protein [Planctomycetota bacterium]
MARQRQKRLTKVQAFQRDLTPKVQNLLHAVDDRAERALDGGDPDKAGDESFGSRPEPDQGREATKAECDRPEWRGILPELGVKAQFAQPFNPQRKPVKLDPDALAWMHDGATLVVSAPGKGDLRMAGNVAKYAFMTFRHTKTFNGSITLDMLRKVSKLQIGLVRADDPDRSRDPRLRRQRLPPQAGRAPSRQPASPLRQLAARRIV